MKSRKNIDLKITMSRDVLMVTYLPSTHHDEDHEQVIYLIPDQIVYFISLSFNGNQLIASPNINEFNSKKNDNKINSKDNQKDKEKVCQKERKIHKVKKIEKHEEINEETNYNDNENQIIQDFANDFFSDGTQITTKIVTFCGKYYELISETRKRMILQLFIYRLTPVRKSPEVCFYASIISVGIKQRPCTVPPTGSILRTR